MNWPQASCSRILFTVEKPIPSLPNPAVSESRTCCADWRSGSAPEQIVKHLPTSLTEFGVPREDLEALVASGMEVIRLLVSNMREVTPDDARSIYLEVL